MPAEIEILIPMGIKPVILSMASLGEEQLDGLSACVDDPNLVRYSPEALALHIEKRTGIPFAEAYRYVQVVAFLLAQRGAFDATEDQLFSAIEEAILEANKGELPAGFEAKRGKFRLLFGPKPKVEMATKRQRLLYGPVKTLRRIESVCDARPLFNLDRSEIKEILYVDVAQLFMADDEGNEEVVVFQMNEESFKALEGFLTVLNRKRTIVRESLVLRTTRRESAADRKEGEAK